MYIFVDHDSHNYVTDSMHTQTEGECDWFEFQPGAGGSPRPVIPTGYADESMICFEREELGEGWALVQTAQVIGATFMEMFDQREPSYARILTVAQQWQQTIIDDMHDDEDRAGEYRVARQLLQGVIDAARMGLCGEFVRWSPWRRGLNLDSKPTPKPSKLGKWYDARGILGGDWKVRQHDDLVEAVRLADGTSRLLTKQQARGVLDIVRAA